MQERKPASDARREWLGAAAVAGAAVSLGSIPREARAERVKTRARIVIAGSGLGGLAVANRLHRSLDGARITIVDAKTEHNYQPGYTLVATGIWPIDKVRETNAEFVPPGVEWVQQMVARFDPVGRYVETTSGQRIEYDYLVVATGLQLDFAQIEGMDVAAIGTNGLASVYPGPSAAAASWKAMDGFRRKGGNAVLTLPSTPLKCAGAPLKMTFMLADRLRLAGTRDRSTIRFHSALPHDTVFGVPAVNDNVLARWKALGIETTYLSKLVAVDVAARRASFASPEGERTIVPYDFLHVVPPMRAVDSVKNSELAWQDGPMAAGGWLEVDKSTLRHRRFPEVFGVGDINGTPRGKTAATVKKSAPIVAGHIVDAIAGRALSGQFDGYTSCPMIVREGSAMLIEFDYEGRLTPSLPFVDPLQESWAAWFMKYRLLKPAYLAVLRGRV